MRILLYADLTWNSLGASYQRAFQQLGHQVIGFDTGELPLFLDSWLRNRILHRLTIRSLRLRAIGARRWNEYFLSKVLQKRPDVVLIVKGDFLMPDTLRQVREHAVPVSILHPDNPFPPHYANRPETIPCMAECDSYFAFSRVFIPPLHDAGVDRAEYLPFGWDPLVFPHSEVNDGTQDRFDMVFIGGWDRWREVWLTQVAMHFDLKIWGPSYWTTKTKLGSPLRKSWQGKAVYGPEAGAILRQAKVALNILRMQNLEGTNMRTFEIPGCGGFSVSTRTSCTLEMLPEGAAGVYFTSPEELLHQIERYLQDSELRLNIRRNAHEIIANEHTYQHRAQTILNCWEKNILGVIA